MQGNVSTHKAILPTFHLLSTPTTILLSPCSTTYGSCRHVSVHPAASHNFCSPALPTATAEQREWIAYKCTVVFSLLLASCGLQTGIYKTMSLFTPSMMPSYAIVRIVIRRNEYIAIALIPAFGGGSQPLPMLSSGLSGSLGRPGLFAKALAIALPLFSRRRFYRLYLQMSSISAMKIVRNNLLILLIVLPRLFKGSNTKKTTLQGLKISYL
jgi:hypothetical protein